MDIGIFNLQIIDLETDEVPKEQNLQEALRLKRPDYIARTKVYGTNQSLITCLQIYKYNYSETWPEWEPSLILICVSVPGRGSWTKNIFQWDLFPPTFTKQTESRISIAMFMINSAWFFALGEETVSIGGAIVWHSLLRGSCNSNKAILDSLHLVDVVLVAEDVEHAKHLV